MWRPCNDGSGWTVRDETGRDILGPGARRLTGDRARLFAAAPKLLAACEAFIATCDNPPGPEHFFEALDTLEQQIRAAVKEAKGE